MGLLCTLQMLPTQVKILDINKIKPFQTLEADVSKGFCLGLFHFNNLKIIIALVIKTRFYHPFYFKICSQYMSLKVGDMAA